MKVLTLIALVFFFYSCETKPYINHEMKAEKVGACSVDKGSYKVTPNINGERYEFDHCLVDGFDVKNYSIVRKGDTLLLDLPAPKANDNTALYKVILDVHAYPKYNYIKIGDDVLNVVTTGN